MALGRSLSPRKWTPCYGFPPTRAEGLALGLGATTGGTGKGMCGMWVKHLDKSVPVLTSIAPTHGLQLSPHARPREGHAFPPHIRAGA